MKTDHPELIADAARPLLCGQELWEEMLLYNIPRERQAELCATFTGITGKAVDEGSNISELSGGQKVILMACLAVFSPAEALCFIDLEHSLDTEKYAAVLNLLHSSGKRFRLVPHA